MTIAVARGSSRDVEIEDYAGNKARFAFEERRAGDRRGWPKETDFTQLTLDTGPKPE